MERHLFNQTDLDINYAPHPYQVVTRKLTTDQQNTWNDSLSNEQLACHRESFGQVRESQFILDSTNFKDSPALLRLNLLMYENWNHW